MATLKYVIKDDDAEQASSFFMSGSSMLTGALNFSLPTAHNKFILMGQSLDFDRAVSADVFDP